VWAPPNSVTYDLERVLYQSGDRREMWHSRPLGFVALAKEPRLCQRRPRGARGVQARAPVPTLGIPLSDDWRAAGWGRTAYSPFPPVPCPLSSVTWNS